MKLRKNIYLCSMKKIFTLLLSILLSTFALYSQRDSLHMFDMTIMPNNYTISVFIYTDDGKIDYDTKFNYFLKGSNKKLSKKQVPKECRIKMKRNKKLSEHSYIFTYPALEGVVSNANYSPQSNTYLFFTQLDGKRDMKITDFFFEYEDKKLKKLKSINILYKSFLTGSAKIRTHKYE